MCKLFLTLITFVCITSVDARIPRVRVLLAEQSLPLTTAWSLKSEQGFYLYHMRDARVLKREKYTAPTLDIRHKRSHWYVNDMRLACDRMLIVPVNKQIGFQANTYQGFMLLVPDHQKALLINCLALEEYVYAVLRTESWPGWPLEVNKVQAIACRTYVVSMMADATKQKRPYHVKNTNEHQTYTGLHTCPIKKQAVEQTSGMFLSHNDKPIRAMFDTCCGGVIPAHVDGVNFVEAPYLARNYPCTHCKRCSVYSWKAAYTVSELEQLIKPHVPHVRNMCSLQITKKDKAGLVKEAMVHGGKKKHKMPGRKLYSLCKKVKSFCFGVRTHADTVVFEGKGYGHHMGLCQWGAREMVRDGWDYKRILQFYYPATDFKRLA
jgi:stage II sporulation protein D